METIYEILSKMTKNNLKTINSILRKPKRKIAHNMLLLDSGGDDKECPSHLGIGRKRMVTIFVKKDDKQQI